MHFPREKDGLREFLNICLKVKNELDLMFAAASFKDLGDASARFPTVLTYRNATLQQGLDECLDDPRLKALVSSLWGYMGVPPSKAAFVSFAGMLTSILEGGQSYCRGSFQKLVDAFVEALIDNHGELLLNTNVDRIVIEDGQAAASCSRTVRTFAPGLSYRTRTRPRRSSGSWALSTCRIASLADCRA